MYSCKYARQYRIIKTHFQSISHLIQSGYPSRCLPRCGWMDGWTDGWSAPICSISCSFLNPSHVYTLLSDAFSRKAIIDLTTHLNVVEGCSAGSPLVANQPRHSCFDLLCSSVRLFLKLFSDIIVIYFPRRTQRCRAQRYQVY